MNTDEFRRLRETFDSLASLPPAERVAKLDHDPAIGASTRRHLRALLETDAALAETTVRAPIGALRADGRGAWIGSRVGAFVIERELGRGGMGSVFLAHRVDGGGEQKVAIKLIRPEQLDEHTSARFRVERRVLAMLKHPHIATFVDLGETADGMPYIAMEYVDGLSITTFCEKNRLDLPARLRLFLNVCSAVSHAHRSLIVHRDLKPSNILVTTDGRPKLLDFGIAKPLQPRFATQAIEETTTAQRFFSPYSAAPEQLRGETITVACDVYGLGVLLYELLTRCVPLDFTGKPPREIERMILDVEPPAPSARAALPALRGDLDAIVRRTLRKDPAQRYASVNQLADDVRRFLHRRPVAARRGNWLYRSGRFFARRRFAVAAASLLIVLLAFAAWFPLHRSSSVEQQRAQKVAALGAAATPVHTHDQDSSAHDAIEQLSSQTSTGFDLDRGQRAQLLVTIAKTYLRLDLPHAALDSLARIGERDSSWDAALTNDIALNTARASLETSDFEGAAKLIRAGLLTTGSDRYPWTVLNARLLWAQGKSIELESALAELSRSSAAVTFESSTQHESEFLAHHMHDKAVTLAEPARSQEPTPRPVPAAAGDSTSAVSAPGQEPEPGKPTPENAIAQTGPDHVDNNAVQANARQVELEAALAKAAQEEHRRRMESVSADSVDRDARDTMRSVPDADAPDARSPPGHEEQMLLLQVGLANELTRSKRFAESAKVIGSAEAAMARSPALSVCDAAVLVQLVHAVNVFGESPSLENRERLVEIRNVAASSTQHATTRELGNSAIEFANSLLEAH